MKQKILIVENELLIAKHISLILESEGYETKIGITTVDEALNELKINDYNLVLIDVNLNEESDGTDLGSYLLDKDNIPYIYITSYSDNVSVERIKTTRPQGIIIKPFKPVDVITSVSIVLNNFKHKNIDVFRQNDELKNEIPFILKVVIDYINENLNKKIDLHELSDLTKWSHQHFIKLFTQFVGQTPYQYILQKKIEKAKAIIIETDVVLSTLSSEFGFESYSNFFKAFKKETGYTPDYYRKMNQIKRHIK
jgi:AraC-like DNA-binding protein/ActR/RegA family two-component response regulator